MRNIRFLLSLLSLLSLAGLVRAASYINGTGFNNLQAPSGYGTSGQVLQTNGDGTSTWVTGSAGTITGVTAGTGLTGGGSSGAVTLTSVVSTYSVSAAGSAYSLTTTTAAVAFGTTSPSVTLGGAGTYLILTRANLKYNAATFAANQTVKLTLRRTNNTAAYITSAETNPTTRIITTITDDFGVVTLPEQIYTTANSGDVIALWGNITTAPAAGSVDVNEASIVAVRLF